MPRNHVVHNCGCTQVHYLDGNARERDFRCKTLSQRDCDTCQAQDIRETSGLKGSDKQVIWADQIRTLAAHEMSQILGTFFADGIPSAEDCNPWDYTHVQVVSDQIEDRDPGSSDARSLRVYCKMMQTQKSSKWWIDNRSNPLAAAVSDPAQL